MFFGMDFQSAMETFAEAWVAASAGAQTQALALTRPKSPKKESSVPVSPSNGREVELSSPKVHHQSSASSIVSDHPSATGDNLTGSSVSNSIANANGGASLGTPHSHPTISVSQSLMGTAINRSLTPRINVSASSMTENGSGANASININNANNSNTNNNSNNNMSSSSIPVGCHPPQTPSNGADRGIPPSPVAVVAAAAAAMQDRKDFDFSKVNAKSLPLHCVVESVSSLQATLNFDARSPWKRRPNIETDSYVIIPAATSFCDIVTTALQRLGYSSEISNAARGSISIKNWKALSLDAISDNPLVSVNDILGELTSVVTLKITILRHKPSQLAEIKDKLLKLLILQSHAVLRSTGCPLDEITLSQICRSPLQNAFPFTPEITDEVRRKFDQWWSNQLAPQPNPIAHKILPFANAPPSELDFGNFNMHENRDALLENRPNPHHNLVVHPALQTVHSQYPNQKTRMRTSFDPEMELPKLQRWFQENPHPSRQQIQSYVVQLNSLESRRGRKPLDVNNVVYWFKNARAAQKRAEMRQGMTNGYGNPGMMLSQPDYMKSSPSAPSEDIDNLSQDEMDDELDRPMSPQLPLSLTIHERNRPLSPTEDTPIKQENNPSSASPPPSPPPPNHMLNMSSNNNNNANESANDSTSQNEAPKSNYSNERSSSPQRSRSPASEDLDMDEPEGSTIDDYRSPSPDSKRNLPFPINNPMFSHSIMYMSHYIPAMQANAAAGMHLKNELSPTNHAALGQGGLNLSFNSDERRKRNRTFIDPVTEVPKLEQWFSMNTHPSHNLILKYTEDLNRMPYRQKFPRLESKNVQFWFKNRRAKCKRLKMSLYDPAQLASLGEQAHLANLHDSSHLAQLHEASQLHQFHHGGDRD
ncbi:dual specificity protein kinase splA [Topomyia yanbarensis]|uniref:dual specificity protein kinase splA n=1 Tax=Topomyia yanbarensis TaxID=2498891 RepID=UPI00273CAA0A|nr:dual specificity protein kinase splA [Topomyia yanbarensis]